MRERAVRTRRKPGGGKGASRLGRTTRPLRFFTNHESRNTNHGLLSCASTVGWWEMQARRLGSLLQTAILPMSSYVVSEWVNVFLVFRGATTCDSSSLPPHFGFVFEWVQKIYPELGKIAHVAGHDR